MKPRAPEPEVGDVVAVRFNGSAMLNVEIAHVGADRIIGTRPGTLSTIDFAIDDVIAYGRIPNA